MIKSVSSLAVIVALLGVPAASEEVRPGQVALEITALSKELVVLHRERDQAHKFYIRALYTVEANTSRCQGRSKELALIDARKALTQYLENPIASMNTDVETFGARLADGSSVIDGVATVCRKGGYPPFNKETLPVAAAATQVYNHRAKDLDNHITGLRDAMLEGVQKTTFD